MSREIKFYTIDSIPYAYRHLKTSTAIEYFEALDYNLDNGSSNLIDEILESLREPHLLVDEEMDIFEPIYDCHTELVYNSVMVTLHSFDILLPKDAIIFWK
jgi:hypothetical protein